MDVRLADVPAPQSPRVEYAAAGTGMRSVLGRTTGLALSVVVAILFTACGGGGSSTSSGSTTTTSGTSSGAASGSGGLSKADYLAQGDAICTANVVKLQALPRPSQSDMQATAAVLPQLLAIAGDELAKLRGLKAPAADQATIDAIFAEFDTAFADIQKAGDAASAGDSTAFQSDSQAAGPAIMDATTKLHTYGFQHCPSSGGSAPSSAQSSSQPSAN
jgi:hypothetical protein